MKDKEELMRRSLYPKEKKVKMKEPIKHEDPYDFGDRFELKTAAENIADFNSKLGEALENQAQESQMREFNTGATRGTDEGKFDYEGFLSPLALCRYAEYMHKHRTQADGKLRDSDNWQKGIPLSAYMKSLWRHLIDLWTLHHNIPIKDRIFGLIKDRILGLIISEEATHIKVTKEETLCAIIFNAFGYLHELEKKKQKLPDSTLVPMTKLAGDPIPKRQL